MADLPLLYSSSPTSSPSSHTGSSSPNSCFLVHSVRTLAANLPPDIDNKPLARQKRRRTSKDDEEILKAEYAKNPKPDKAARMEIVSKVALGEKEVQIWFQNKRQNDRRRSRPLDNSSTPHLMSSSSTMSDPSTEEEGNLHGNENENENTEEQNYNEEEPKLEQVEQVEIVEVASAGCRNINATIAPIAADSQGTVESITVASTDPRTIDTIPTELNSSQQTMASSQGTSQPRTSWISNRRSASFIRSQEEHLSDVTTAPTGTLKRAHSFVRLSLTADGGARVITDADQSPSPPHVKSDPSILAHAAAGLRRSYSAAGLNERLAAASRGEPIPKMARTLTNAGRSRDSRAWEFWCDPDSRHRGSLTAKAEQETSGSAADAIGLLRANRRVLGSNQSRQNTPVLSRNDSSKGLGNHGIKKSRPQMERASTSYGRLQTKDDKKEDSVSSDELPQTESDKENWEPDVPQSQSRRPRPHSASISSQHPRQILGENTDLMSQSSSLGTMMAREKGNGGEANGTENVDPDQDEELSMFMNGGRLSGRTSLSSAEEAGCVEGLLKLSQGNWR
ncbi:uncharacterized protein BDR25DRAFT_262937 [Lindgomyces ingoldianus]|uniref:Uncharacterized protein n=1 Tax=Lindgomyces ingoldianus TaxID=673940 RepID=A0ACB6QTH7_9PLEO|nr:uncharacterized protein BDR25DRAFT_262937 [Lindgomyces ingoldianus]KAF2470190.1 hypothetical protein BDR25DRAFT_262937 [Lindgomyces ingoldianus]